MPDLVHVTYAQTGKSSQTNNLGMREMQEKAFQARDAQYFLLKAPPASGDSRLGELIRSVMGKSTAHIVAMTGSYFLGDSVPVLHPDDEDKFTAVTYTYSEQLKKFCMPMEKQLLNGMKLLTNISIGIFQVLLNLTNIQVISMYSNPKKIILR
jgi:hypothetical protein